MRVPDPRRLWDELRRRRVVRTALYYVAAAWVLAQALDLLLDAFEASRYMRFVVAALVLGLPVVSVLAWIFDLTPAGLERTPALSAAAGPPVDSIAVLPFANLSQEPDNEYFSDGLAEEIRNQLARVPGLRVAARSSSFAFKGRHEDVREIGRRLNVASLLEGGVRRQAGTVRIDVQLVNAADGYQAWSESFERRLDDIFRLQTEVACAVIAAVRPRAGGAERPPPQPGTQSFDAYNLYLLGRHHFHKRTEAALRRAIECFRQAIERDPDYALAHAGLADAYTLASTGYYGELPTAESIANALPAALRALELAPGLAEVHASLGLIRHNQGEYALAQQALARAIELNPNYTMAHVWSGLVLTSQGRYGEAAAHMREAFRLDPLSPIVNANVGFDALRFGDHAQAQARFAAAIEIDPAFPVPYSGMARLEAARGRLEEALAWIDRAAEKAPNRSFYLARRGLVLAQLGRLDEAVVAVEAACRHPASGRFARDLLVGLRIAHGDRAALESVARAEPGSAWAAAKRAQALLAIGEPAAALQAYAEDPPDAQTAINDVINDDWVWRLPHVVNHAHLRLASGDEGGRAMLEELLAHAASLRAEGIVNADVLYWVATARAVLGERERALECLEEALRRGWRQAWWARCDWNWSGHADDGPFRALLERAGPAGR